MSEEIDNELNYRLALSVVHGAAKEYFEGLHKAYLAEKALREKAEADVAERERFIHMRHCEMSGLDHRIKKLEKENAELKEEIKFQKSLRPLR